MNGKNAFFRLQIGFDGTYLRLSNIRPGAKEVSLDAIVHYFNLIQFKEYDREQLKASLQGIEKEKTIKLTNNKIRPVDEYVEVKICSGDEEAVATVYAPSNGGRTLAKEEILNALYHSRIKYGIDEQLIDNWVLNRIYNTEMVIARAKHPVQGKNGSVEYCFNTNATPQPRINEDGTVDYHQLDNIVHIQIGEKLAYLEPAVKGKDGMLVTGVPISAAKVKTPKLKYGRNIAVSEDGSFIYSEVAGHAYVVEGKVFVANIYEVLANVDASTGDIEYDGDIRVKGNVCSGFSLKATGQIYVEGVVEGATLHAEGPIIIKGGIQGMAKARIVSHSSVTAKFIENATVEAGGNVLADAIIHSKVTSYGNVLVEGRKGLVLGGAVHAKESIKLKVAGSPMSAFTTIEVGSDPDMLKEHRNVEEEARRTESEFQQLSQILITYRKKLGNGIKLTASQVATVTQIAQHAKQVEKKLSELQEYREELKEEIHKSDKGKIIVGEKVYPSVKIEISSAVLIIKKETYTCAFIKDGIDVKEISNI